MCSSDLLATVAEGLEEVRRSGQAFAESELHRLGGELHLLRREPDTAETCFRQAIDIARAQSAKSFELRAAISLARLWQGQRRTADARLVLESARSGLFDGSSTPDAKAADALLATLR